MTDHGETLNRAFTDQAASFEALGADTAWTAATDWLFDRLALAPDDLVLDVAAGTGHVARRLAPSVRAVVALDATTAMMAAGQAHAVRDGIDNVVFLHGAAEHLPFLDDSFDVVVTRFSLHHMVDPGLAIAEMARCLRPGGRMLVADLLSSPDPALGASQDRLETLRDPSHTRSLNRAELQALMADPGLVDVSLQERDLHTPLRRWLVQAQPPDDIARSIEVELRAELSGDAAPTGFQPFLSDGELHFVQRLASALAVSPGSSSAGRPPTDR